MEWVETTGKTVGEALEVALDELGVDEHDAEVVIVAEAKSGLFGIGRSDARVRARVRPSAPRPKRPQRGRRREQRPGGKSQAEPTVTTAGEGDDGSGTKARAKPATKAGAGQANQGTGRRRSRGGAGRSEGQSTETRSQRATTQQEGTVSVDQQAEVVGTFVRGVVERFGYPSAETIVRVEDDHILVDVTGDELGLLIGPRGRTLDALQELARTVGQRRGEEQGARVVVDVAGFRAKRTAALEGFVRRVASEVLSTGVAEELEPMSASDRKVVHDTINSIDGVESTSEGVDPHRHVVLRPTSAGNATP